MIGVDATLITRVGDLRAGRTPFVLATVVRAERPTSAKPGDCALVLQDGTIDGFVGGSCAESTVRLESLRLLRAGESGLLRITPDADEGAEKVEGLRTVGNPCLSGGTLEIFLEAMVPPTLVAVFGEAPVARALVRIGAALDYDVQNGQSPTETIAPDTAAVVVASHGRDEAPALQAALSAEVPYIALVASRRRAAGVRDELAALGVPDEQVARVSSPAGLDIGSRSPSEIALSVFAEMIAARVGRPAAPGSVTSETATPAGSESDDRPDTVDPVGSVATDPVCGMSVATVPTSLSAQHASTTYWFCGSGCRQAFLDEPGRYTG